jgi:hypothetical protein
MRTASAMIVMVLVIVQGNEVIDENGGVLVAWCNAFAVECMSGNLRLGLCCVELPANAVGLMR